jgi:UPF0755 protein
MRGDPVARMGAPVSDLGLGTPTQTPAAQRPARRHRGHGVLATLVALGIVVALVGGVAYFGRAALTDVFASSEAADFTGPGGDAVTVQIEQGDSVSAIGSTLEAAGVVASVEAFVDAAAEEPRSTSIQPGTYGLQLELPAADAVALLVDPANRQIVTAVLPEGLRLGESLQRLADGTGVPLADFEAAVAVPTGLGLPAYAGSTVEGFVFPATYEFEPGLTAAEILATTVERYNHAATTLDLEARAAAAGGEPLDVVVIASILEAEAARAEDLPQVSRVIYNRLAANMPLQMDSTVHYAVGKRGSVFTTDEERATDSPYNTYRYPGLPPGPIGSPGEAALEAALNPAAGGALFFVTVNLETGETRFAATDTEHAANVALLQEYCATSDLC